MFKIPSDCRRFRAHCSRRLLRTLRSNAATELADKAQRGRWDICVVIALGDHCDPRTWPRRRSKATNTSQSKDTDSSSKQAHRVEHTDEWVESINGVSTSCDDSVREQFAIMSYQYPNFNYNPRVRADWMSELQLPLLTCTPAHIILRQMWTGSDTGTTFRASSPRWNPVAKLLHFSMPKTVIHVYLDHIKYTKVKRWGRAPRVSQLTSCVYIVSLTYSFAQK